MTPSWNELEIGVSEASPMAARVVAKLPLADDTLQLGGVLVGPECETAQTLPASASFVPRSEDRALVAEAVVVDPCFWTAKLPFVYRAKLELRRGDQVVDRHEQVLALKKASDG